MQRNGGFGEWAAFVLAAVAIAAGSILVTGQITVPNTFVNGTVADASQVNANFNALATGALNRTGGTMTGTINSRDITPTVDATYSLGTGALRFNELRAVTLFGAGSNITALNASSIASGTVASARGGVGIDASAPTDGQLLIGKTSDGSWNKATVTAGAGISVTNGAGALTIANTATSSYGILGGTGFSGTDTNAAAATVASVATGTLTAFDTLRVVYTIESVTAATNNIVIYSVTDGVSIITISAGSQLAAGSIYQGEATVRVRQGSTTLVVGTAFGMNSASASESASAIATLTTAWTTGLTIGVRHTGVLATGTFKYSVAFYKVAGQ